MHSLLAAAVFSALAPGPDDKDKTIVVPLRGLKAQCCEMPVSKALAALPGVQSCTVKVRGDLYVAEIVFKSCDVLRLSDIEKGLAAANKEMGDAMGTRYEVDGSMSVECVHYLVPSEKPAEETVKKALSGLPGFQCTVVKERSIVAVFEGEKIPTLADLRAALSPADVVFAPQKDGRRFVCPRHQNCVSATPMKCCECGTEMEKVQASRVVAKKTEKRGG
ncbi:MAG: hypothetical protein HYY17_14610 [Planctomycetes bacterium]|nr:hypothetical protein [Planctomycetota bacterium]